MKKLPLLLIFALALFSCQKEPIPGGKLVEGDVKIDISVAMPSTKFGGGGATQVTDHHMRVKLEVWEKGGAEEAILTETKVVDHSVVSSVEFSFELPADTYDFLFWADFVTPGTDSDLYYNTASLKDVKRVAAYDGGHAQDAYASAVMDLNIAVEGFSFPAVTLLRPLARLEVVATDFSNAPQPPVKARLIYDGAIPGGFNVATGDITAETVPAHQFEMSLEDLGGEDGNKNLCFDYIFAAKTELATKIGFTVELLDEGSGVLVSKTVENIGLVQNRQSQVRRAFFAGATDPAMTVSSQMQAVPGKELAPQVNVSWVNASLAAKIKLTPVNPLTDSYPIIVHEFSAEEQASASAVITDSYLIPQTQYTAEILDASDNRLVSGSVTTPDLPDNVQLVVPASESDAANYLRVILGSATRKETVYFVPGAYNLPTAGNNVALGRNLHITAASPELTSLAMERTFRPSGTLDFFIFENLTMSTTTYVIQNNDAASVEIQLLKFDNCVIDLNSSATSSSSLYSAANTNEGAIKEYVVNNCIIHANQEQAQAMIYNSSSTTKERVEKFVITNSTLANCGRGIVYMTYVADYPVDFTMDKCTVYGIESLGNYAMVDIRAAGTSARTYSFTNNIVWFGAANYRLLNFATGAVPKDEIEVDNFYYFSGQTPTYGGSAYNITEKLTAYPGEPTDMWENPQRDPVSAGASFRIIDGSVDTEAGDPRWNR